MRIWVIAIRWRATLSWRLPPRLRRWRTTLPDQTGTGARAVVAGECLLGAEAADAGRLADELGRRQGAAAGEGEQGRRERARRARAISRSSASIAPVSSRIRATGRGRCGRRARSGRRAPPRGRRGRPPGRATAGRGSAIAELDEVPAQALPGGRVRSATRSSRWSTRRRSSRSGPVERGDRQVGLAQRGPGDREGVDRVALAGLADRAAGAGHELGRDAHDGLAGRAADRASRRRDEVAAVLERPAALAATADPAAELEVAVGRRPDRLARRACGRSRRPRPRVAALVQIRAEDDHVPVSSSYEVTTEDRSADTAEWGRCHAPIKSRRPVRRV